MPKRIFSASVYFCAVRQLLQLLDWFLCTSLLTTCCAAGLCMATERLLLGAVPAILSPLHLLVVGSTMAVYNLPRIVRRRSGAGSQRFGSWYSALFFVGCALLFWGWAGCGNPVRWVAAGSGIFALAYFLPMLPFADRKRLRDYGWVKITVLAVVWTVATSVLPIIDAHRHVAAYPFEILLRFTFIFSLCVIFDIRDVREDMRNNIATLPLRVGLRNSYRLIYTMLILFVVFSTLQYLRYPDAERIAGALITAIATVATAAYLRNHPSDRGYMGLADGVMLLYAVLVLLPVKF